MDDETSMILKGRVLSHVVSNHRSIEAFLKQYSSYRILCLAFDALPAATRNGSLQYAAKQAAMSHNEHEITCSMRRMMLLYRQ